jgi:hypothetical protein
MSVIKFGAWQDLSGNEVANSTEPVGDVGLVLVKTQTIGSGVSSVTVTDVFSSDYTNYRVVLETTCSSSATFLGKIGNATSGYNTSHFNINQSGTLAGLSFVNDNEMEELSVASTNGTFMTLDLFRPNQAAITGYQSVGSDTRSGGAWMRTTSGWLNDNTQHTYIVLYPRSGTMTGGSVQVYGYRN